MDHTMQRRTFTSQRLGWFVGSSSIACPGVLLRAVSSRVLPEAVTQAVTTRDEKEFSFDALWKERPGYQAAGGGPVWSPLAVRPHMQRGESRE